MKWKIAKIVTTVVLMSILVFVGGINCLAVKINNNDFAAGDKVTYIVQIKSKTVFSGINAVIEYPKDTLTLDKDSLNIPELGSMVISNADEEGFIRFVATDVQSGFDFSDTKLIVTVTFTVKDGAKDSDITFKVTEATDTQLNDVTLTDNEIIKSIQKGEYDGKIVNPGNGKNLIDDGAYIDVDNSEEDTPTDTKSRIIVITLAAAFVLILTASLIVKVRSKSSKK